MTGEQAAEDAIRLTLTVPAPAERAFAVFAEGFASWYPGEYTWSQDVLDTIAIEGRWVDRVVGLDGVGQKSRSCRLRTAMDDSS